MKIVHDEQNEERTCSNEDYLNLLLIVSLWFYNKYEINDDERNSIDWFFRSLFYEFDRELSEEEKNRLIDRWRFSSFTGTQHMMCGRRTCKSPFWPRFTAVDWSVKVWGDEYPHFTPK